MHCKRPTDTPGKLDYCIKPWMAAAATHERLESCSRKPEPRLAARESSAGGSMGPGECGSSSPLPRRSPRPPGASWTEGPPLLAFERLSTEQSPLTRYCSPEGVAPSPVHLQHAHARTRTPQRRVSRALQSTERTPGGCV